MTTSHPPRKPKLLFITANRVGDAVLATGILAAMLERMPEAEVMIACGPYAAGLFRGVPRLRRLYILNKQKYNRHWLGLWRACIGTRWDMIVDIRNSAISRLLLSNKRYRYHRSQGRHKVVENAAIIGQQATPPAPRLWLTEAAQDAARTMIPAGKPILALGPAANWPCKQWPAERFAALAQKLTAADGPLPNAMILVPADTREREQLQPLFDAFPPERLIPMIGEELTKVAACLGLADLFIGNDSGLMHLAAAMGVPTLGLFGPGYEDIYGPWGQHTAVVRTPESREELLARLPHPGAHSPNLMMGLEVDTVVQAAINLLSRLSVKAPS
ncbi:MAG: glycosyltransferase family 9 protein [Alphaproteobacteria bacterium]|nr:glycosyltransferase family 9 protein [Alphaproteobacteria bacterium]